MKFFVVTLFAGSCLGIPTIFDKRTTCKIGGIDKLGAADAACSVSVSGHVAVWLAQRCHIL